MRGLDVGVSTYWGDGKHPTYELVWTYVGGKPTQELLDTIVRLLGVPRTMWGDSGVYWLCDTNVETKGKMLADLLRKHGYNRPGGMHRGS